MATSLNTALPPAETIRCPQCGGDYEGTVIRLVNEEVTSSCPSCEGSKAALPGAHSVQPQEASISVLVRLERAGVNVRRYRDATLSSFDPSDDPQALEAADAYVGELKANLGDRYADLPWFFAYGGGSNVIDGKLHPGKTGNGKTHLAVAIARHLMEQGALDPARFAFRNVERVLLEIEASYRNQDSESALSILDAYARYDLLVLDDLGVRGKLSDHAMRVLDQIVRDREGRATIYTTNYSLPTLKQQHEAMMRLASRIAGETGDGARYVIEMRGRDRRIERSKRAKT